MSSDIDVTDLHHFVQGPYQAAPKLPLHVADAINPFEEAVKRQIRADREHLAALHQGIDCLPSAERRETKADELRLRCELAAALRALGDIAEAAAALPAGDLRASVLSPLDSWRAARAKINLRVRPG